MILRRFIKHVREENWFAVGIDFFVVVIGIFVGLQVESWNQERQSRITETRFIERLYQDQLSSLSPLEKANNDLNYTSNNIRTIINYLEGASEQKPTFEEMNSGLCRWFIPGSIVLLRTTYDELISTGQLNLIRNEEFRIKLQEVYNQHDTVLDDYAKFGDTIKIKAALLSPFLDWRIIPLSETVIGSEENSGTECNIDLEGMKNSREARSIIPQLYRSQIVYKDWRETQLKVTKNLIKYMDDNGMGAKK